MAKSSKKLGEAELTSRLQEMVRGAVGVSQTQIEAKQAEALRLYRREPFDKDYKDKDHKHPTKPGSSLYVSSDVQERVDWSTAGVIKVFDSQQQVVSFEPNGPEDQALADQQTEVVNFIVRNKNSHVAMLEPWLKNGFITGLGIAMVDFRKVREELLPEMIEGLTDEALIQFVQDEEAGTIKIIERGEPYAAPKPELQPGMPPETLAQMEAMPPLMVRDIKIRRIREEPKMCISNLAPEHFIVSEDAVFDQQTGGISARVQGHKRIISRDELIEQGFDRAKIDAIAKASDDDHSLAVERSKETDNEQGVGDDDVEVYEIYTKMALEDGVRRHYRFTLAGSLGSDLVLLDRQEVSKFYPYAAFVPFPVPNTLFGQGIADRVGIDQTYKTKFIRAIHDNLNWHVNPLKVVDQNAANLDDLLNLFPGKIIRAQSPDAVKWNQPTFAGTAAFPVIDALERSMDYTTGVGGQMASVNPSDLQNTTATANAQRASSQQMMVELICRTFADTGYRYLFRIIVDLLVNNPKDAQKLVSRLTGQFQQMRIDEWDPEMDVTANVAFGVTDKIGATANLQMLMGLQDKLAPMGLSNAQTAYTSAVKLAEIAGYKNPGLFFVDPATAQQQQAAAAQAQQPAPPNPLVEAEQVKAMAASTENEKDRQLKIALAEIEDRRARERDEQDFRLKALEIELKYKAQVDTARIEAEVAAQQQAAKEQAAQFAQLERERVHVEAQAAQQAQQQQAAAAQAQQAQMQPQMPPQV